MNVSIIFSSFFNNVQRFNKSVLFGFLLLGVLVSRITTQPVMAQTAVAPTTNNEVIDNEAIVNEAIVNYPNDVTFRLETDPTVNIVEAVLTYDVTQSSCLDVSTQVPVDVEDGAIEWQWAMIRSGNPPPGAEMWWEWTIRDDQGNVTTTPRQTLTFTDDRFAWRTLQEGDITLNWYAGDDVGPTLLAAAVTGLDLLEADMGIELQEDVTFYIYGSAADMRDAVLYVQDWAGGVAFSEYNVILMGVPPSIAEDWGSDTVRHELAHLVVGQFGRSCVGGHRPTWLEEGLAMYAEGEPSEEVQSDLEVGIAENSFAPLRSLNGAFPAHGDEAGSAYSQSYSVASFLREEYGAEMLQSFLLLLAEGQGTDLALEQVYGFNVDGLESAWRAWLGLQQRPFPPTPTPLNIAALPTVVPLSGPIDVPTPPAAAATAVPVTPQPVPSSPGVCAFGLLPLLGLTLLARKRS